MENFSLFRKTEKTPEEKREEQFRSYVECFHLTEEELQKPILDVGSGDTAFIQYVRNVLNNKQAYGVEKYRSNMDSSKEGLVMGNGLTLPFKDGAFEIVTAKHYLPQFVDNEKEMTKAVDELIRVTAFGGKIMGDISTPERELEKLERPSVWKNEKRKIELKNRYEGSKKLRVFLENLKENGYLVSFEEDIKNDATIVTIQKP